MKMSEQIGLQTCEGTKPRICNVAKEDKICMMSDVRLDEFVSQV